MGTLILVRHATTAASAGGRNLGQRTDPPLSDAGAQLAQRLGVALASEMVGLGHDELRLLTSPALRCRQTSDAILAAVSLAPQDVEVAPGLLEIDYGAWDGLTADECRARDPELRAAWGADPFETRCPQGESGSDVARRVATVLDPLEAWLAAESGRMAIVIGHNHVNRLRLCALMGWPMREYRHRLWQDPAGYSIIGFGGRSPMIRRLNAVPA